MNLLVCILEHVEIPEDNKILVCQQTALFDEFFQILWALVAELVVGVKVYDFDWGIRVQEIIHSGADQFLTSGVYLSKRDRLGAKILLQVSSVVIVLEVEDVTD